MAITGVTPCPRSFHDRGSDAALSTDTMSFSHPQPSCCTDVIKACASEKWEEVAACQGAICMCKLFDFAVTAWSPVASGYWNEASGTDAR